MIKENDPIHHIIWLNYMILSEYANISYILNIRLNYILIHSIHVYNIHHPSLFYNI